jgi:type I restriction enzyme S subunit
MYKSISELAQINPGNTLPSGVRPMDDVSFIPMSDVSESGEWTGRQVRSLRSVSSGFTSFSDNDVLVAKITPCFENGKGTHVKNLVNGAGFGSTEFHVLRAYPGVSPRFIHHVSQSTQLRRAGEAHMVGSAGQKRVPREFFDVFKVPDFSHDEQIKISHVLDTLDTTIRQTEAIIEKLKQVKQGLLHDLLTRGIDANGELRLSQNKAPEIYKNSYLGHIPLEWENSTLGALAEFRSGYAFKNHELSSDGLKVIRISNLHKPDFPFWRYSGKFSPDILVKNGDLLFSWAGVAASIDAYIYQGDEALLNQHIYNITIPDQLLRKWVYVCLCYQLPKIRESIEGGAGQLHLTKSKIKNIGIPVPPAQEIYAILEILSINDQQIYLEEKQGSQLKMVKSGLMDDLLTGRVRVTPLLESAAA